MLKYLVKIRNYYLKKTNPVKWARNLGVIVGHNTTLPPETVFSSEPYLITIGNNVQITANVSFFTHGGGHVAERKHPKFDVFGKIIVEDWVYIGNSVIILPGVTIGEGSLIGAGSVVTKSIPNDSVVAGNPARVICTVDEYIARNLKYNLNTLGMDPEQKKTLLLSLPEDQFVSK